jgi:hypothetical protein
MISLTGFCTLPLISQMVFCWSFLMFQLDPIVVYV